MQRHRLLIYGTIIENFKKEDHRMKMKQTLSLVFATGMLLESLSAGVINVKKADGKDKIQVVAPVIKTVVIPKTNPNIKVAVLSSKKDQIPYPALKDDLVNVGSPTLAKVTMENFKKFGACAAKSLNDGKVGLPSNQNGVTFDLDGKWITTFQMDTGKSPNGYDITEIITSAGWPPNRACQKYELLISRVSAPEKYVSQGIFEVDAKNSLATQIKLTAKKNMIASNVASVQFKFMVPKSATGGATQTTYREIDVIGTPSK
jgi:hypothetical protein